MGSIVVGHGSNVLSVDTSAVACGPNGLSVGIADVVSSASVEISVDVSVVTSCSSSGVVV